MNSQSGVCPIAETLFYFCFYAYLQGNLKEASIYFDLIKEEFKEKNRPDILEAHQLIELKKIKNAIKTGNIASSVGLETPIAMGPEPETPSEIDQKRLVKEIYLQGTEQLKEILKDSVFLYNIEHPCGNYGAVDMLYRGKETVYPLEVKKDQGKHDIIGQINKYTLFHRLHLHLKLYKYVQPVTVCQSYLSYVLKELKQLNVITLSYHRTDSGIKLSIL
jgi:hypothetical protein